MLLGAAIAGRFVIESQAGQGGTGTVYRAWDREGGQAVALKLLDGAGAADLRRFEREAGFLSRLTHESIVRYLAHGVTLDNVPYLAMEWLEGETLSSRLDAGRLPVVDALDLGARVARALAFAHEQGLVHRDVKPGNLFLPGGDLRQVRVLDFGVARRAGDVRLTHTGSLVGTPRYMSPEQARGQRDVGPAADVFALGCVLHECVTGKAAFEGADMMAVLARIILEEAPSARDREAGVPAALDDLLARMLTKDPAARPASAAAVARELEAIATEIAQPGAHPVPRRTPPRGLGAVEKRVICVVLAQGALEGVDLDATAPTLKPGEVSPEGALAELVRPFGGRLERLADGTVTVVLAGAAPAVDQAQAAARCALALRAGLPGVPMAVATGRGVLAARLPVGDVIDRAVSALRGWRAAPGGVAPVRIDEATAGLLDARFDVRGDENGLTVAGEREVEGTRTLIGRPTECVGRDRELAELDAAFREAASERTPRAVLVTAAAGLGKSRLRYELLRRIRAEHPRVTIVFGRGDAVAAGAPFGMLGPALRRLCGVVDGEPAETSRRRVRARVLRHVTDRNAGRVAAFLGELSRVPFPAAGNELLALARQDATVMGDAMRAAFEDWLSAEAAELPVVIVLEDAQWGDLPSIKFVDSALRNLADRPLFVLALGRPEVHARFPGLWADRELAELRLAPLTRRAGERLARDVLGEVVPAATVDRIVTLADGNAFYLEELIRAVASGAGDALPDTVLGMVQARFDALDEQARRVLRAASVFGDRFWRGGVTVLCSDPRERVAAALDDLDARELITRRPVASLPGEVEYVFRHALVMEAAYATLTEGDRALGHRMAGEWLEPFAGVDAARLAQHFDLGREPARALAWYRRAAEQALEGNDFAAAIARATRGLECGATGAQAGALWLVQAEARSWQGDADATARAAAEALALLPRGSVAWFRAAGELVAAASQAGDHPRARSYAREASVVEPEVGAGGAKLSCLCRSALTLMFAGRLGAARELYEQIDRLAEDPGRLDRAVAARVHELAALRAYYDGDPAGNLSGLEGALAAYQAAGDARKACQVRGWLGFAYVELGDFARAQAELRQALAVATRMGLAQVTANITHNLGLVLARLGQLDEARATETRAIELFGGLGVRRGEGVSRKYLALIHLLAGELDASEREARRAVDLLQVAPPVKAGALAMLARVLLARGDAPGGLARAREAIELLGTLGSVDEGETLVRLAYAEALVATGNRPAASAAIASAAARLRERAARIGDALWRRSFLEQVPDCARTLELERELAPPGPTPG